MKTNLTKIIIPAIISIFGFTTLLPYSSVFAVDDVCNTDASKSVKEAAGCYGGGDLQQLITNILNAIIAICGLVAVVFIIIGGVNYMTSFGDSNKLKSARNAIIYATIGLLICALAFAIVNWVIGIIP
jgi:hypothetical protein